MTSHNRRVIRNHIPTWVERCDILRGTTESTIQARMQAEIDDLRAALEAARQRLECINQYVNDEVFSYQAEDNVPMKFSIKWV